MSVEQAYNFVGIDPATATAGLLTAEQLQTLGDAGYEAVVNLLPHDSEFALPSEQDLVRGQGLEYHSIPVDFARPTARDYADFVQAMQALQGRKVLVHCAANYRASAFYAIYAFQHLGWPLERAQAHIASVWNPAEHPPWGDFIAGYLAG
ncbi:protein tyrosine phosphatase family protein [Haliea sp. E17]|uniref:protein tyrosine phosphatase family protein n=1 Tax=Haliea sp. E17 TaxID=3401576 RepID=UPI003AAD7948